MTDRDPALEPFDALIGTWATEATHPLVDAVVPGTITFELQRRRATVIVGLRYDEVTEDFRSNRAVRAPGIYCRGVCRVVRTCDAAEIRRIADVTLEVCESQRSKSLARAEDGVLACLHAPMFANLRPPSN